MTRKKIEETTKKRRERAFIAGRTETLHPAFRREPKNRRDYIFNPNSDLPGFSIQFSYDLSI
jgi:hypothetical protein